MSNITHTQCSCNHLTNFALLMSHSKPVNPGLTSIMAPSKSEKTSLTSNIWIIVLSIASFIVIVVIIIFAAIAWRNSKVSQNCRTALQNSGLPCLNKAKNGELAQDKDKGNNKGNFYTVTPKLNANGGHNSSNNPNDLEDEVVEARQFFEHMINLQKNEQNNTRTMRRSVNDVDPNAGNPGSNQTGTAQAGPAQQDGQMNVKTNNIEQQKKLEIIYPKRNNFARALSPYNHIYMEIEPPNPSDTDKGAQVPIYEGAQAPIYEPLHSETYLMSTMSDLSEDNYNYVNGLNSDVSRQSSSRETRPLIRSISTEPSRANLLQTISGVLHSQSVRIAPSGNNNQSSMTMAHPIRRQYSTTHATLARMNEIASSHGGAIQVANVNGSDFVRLNFDDQANSATYIASTTSDLGVQPGVHVPSTYLQQHAGGGHHQPPPQYQQGTQGTQPHPQFLRANTVVHMQRPVSNVKTAQFPQPQFASEI